MDTNLLIRRIKPWLKRSIFILFAFYCAKSFVYEYDAATEKPSSSSTVLPETSEYRNFFEDGTKYDIHMYLNCSSEHSDAFQNHDPSFWTLSDLTYSTKPDESDKVHIKSVSILLPECLLHNQSLFLHVFVVKLPILQKDKRKLIYGFYRLNKFKHQILQMNSDNDAKNYENKNFINSWHSNLTVNLITDFTVWTYGRIPWEFKKYMNFDFIKNYYYPILYFNDFWNFDEDYFPLNDTVKKLNFTIAFSSLPLLKWECYIWTKYHVNWIKVFTGENDNQKSLEMFKRIIMDPNFVLLYFTFWFFIAYIAMSYRAFQNTYCTWRSYKSYCGFSLPSICFFIFHAAVGFLYCSCNTINWVARRYSLITLLFEFWAIPKCFNLKVNWQSKIFLPCIIFNDSYLKPINSVTKVYNEITFKVFMWMLISCFYTCNNYQNITLPKSYNFSLGFFYGFLTLISAIIKNYTVVENYHLKTIPYTPKHLFLYKFYHVIIDDFMSFLIKMPPLYRLCTFGDDIFFIIFVYQKWNYPVDLTRDNEYCPQHSHKLKND